MRQWVVDSATRGTYHDSSADGDSTTAVGVGNNVAVADRQKRDGYHPHGVENVRVLNVVVTVRAAQQTRPSHNVTRFVMLPYTRLANVIGIGIVTKHGFSVLQSSVETLFR